MKVLNNIIKHIGSSYEANRKYVLESYTRQTEGDQLPWQIYLDNARKANRI